MIRRGRAVLGGEVIAQRECGKRTQWSDRREERGGPSVRLTVLEPVHDLATLVDTTLKIASKYSFIAYIIRFFGHFRLVLSFVR